MTKISKSDQDPNQIDKDREGLANMLSKRSQHFTTGSFVIWNNVRGEILEQVSDGGRNLLRVRWDDGSVCLVEPIALNRR